MQSFKHVASTQKKLWQFYWFQSYQEEILICKVLVGILNGFRKGIGGKHWFSEREHIKLWYFENLKDFWCIKYLCSVVVWRVSFTNFQKSYFLLIFAEFSTFSKKNCHKVTWMTSISFEEVTCKVSDMQLQGKKSYGILANSSHIGRKS